MKHLFSKFTYFIFVLTLFTGCSDDDDNPGGDPALTFKEMESDWVRLSLMYDGNIDVMQADSGEIMHKVSGQVIEGARYYTSNTGRYLTVIDRNGGIVKFFDSGIVNHTDHGHEYTAKWVDMELNSILPTHYASSGGHIVIFNDGDGSISYINEAQLEIPSYQPEIFTFANTVAHHGAGFRLRNGLFATTFKNNTEPGGIPQMVKFVEANGNLIDDNKGIEVEGIHGDAVNGQYGVFGSTNGVILVDDQQNIDLIENIGDLNSESGNWLGTLKGHDNAQLFFARSRNVGVFMVDPVNKTLTNIYNGGNVSGDMFSFDGAYYLLHTADNTISVFDSSTGSKITSRVVEMANIPQLNSKELDSEISILRKMEEPSPVLVCSDKFLYVLAPNRIQIKVLEIKSLEHVHTIELFSPINSLMKNGFSIEGDQNPDYEH
ncbi:hypothetical protein [Aquimarina celericrescens]|uniref:Lipoprotein n=1 Tax=Aquimarina celericrescens TaxID=1964542 RepID=A0ABW5AU61_9FLAO|nr:hypothetical protein [Aquimarina celericrescens]